MKSSGAWSGPRYDPATFWDGVAQRLRVRGFDPDLTGPAGPVHRYKREVLVTRLFSLLPVEDASVLEFGCGPGWNLRVLSERRPKRLVGADIAPEMCKLARRDMAAEIVRFDGHRLPFGDREFDCSFTHAVLQHNPAEALSGILDELTRVTRSTLVLIEDTTGWRERSSGGSYWVRRNHRYIDLVTARGFRVRDVTGARVSATDTTWLTMQRLRSMTERTIRAEGAPASAFEYRVDGAAVRLTRHLDRFFPEFSGKTALRFQRL
jgi:SAM-dependent methyltransferase